MRLNSILFILAWLLIGGNAAAAPLHQTTFNIPNGDIAALRNAITSANGTPGTPVVINLAVNGTYNFTNTLSGSPNHAVPMIASTAGITINGNGSTLTITGGQIARFFLVLTNARLELRNMTLRNGRLTANTHLGGAVSNAGWLKLVNVNFHENRAYACGAVHNHTTATLIVEGSGHYYRNQGDYEGGALCSFGYVTITGSRIYNGNPLNDTFGIVFEENSAPAAGAILGYIHETSITRAKFLNNRAYSTSAGNSGSGGALGLDGGTYTLSQLLFVGNIGERNAGAVFFTRSEPANPTTVTLRDSWFYNNRAGFNAAGAVIYSNGAGGAVFNDVATTTILRSTFYDNRAPLFGGAITNVGTLTLEDAFIEGSIGSFGGAVANIIGTTTGNLTIRAGSQRRSVIRYTDMIPTVSGIIGTIASFGSINIQDTAIVNNENTVAGQIWGVIIPPNNAGTVTLQNNCIANTGGVVNVRSAAINAVNNWWNAASGPSGGGGTGDPINGNIIIAPIRTSPAPACAPWTYTSPAPVNTNLLANSDFSAGLNHWQVFDGVNATVTGGTLTMPIGNFMQTVPHSVNNGTALEFAARIGNPTANPITVRMFLHDPRWNQQRVCAFTVPPSNPTLYRLQTRISANWSAVDAHIFVDTGTATVDNADLRVLPSSPVQTTACTSLLGEMIANGSFSDGDRFWRTFDAIVSRVNGGVYEFYRQPSSTSAVVLQSTGFPLGNGVTLEANFSLGNSSSARKRVTVLIHDSDFSDLAVCTFWLPPNTPLRNYRMYTFTGRVWSGATISFYASTADGLGWYRLDNVSLRYNPMRPATVTQCVDPSAP
jgi:hypothetical protein